MPSPMSHLLTSTITYKTIIGTDGNGDPVFSNPVCIPAYIDLETKIVRNARGEEAVSTTVISSDCEIPELCVIWLADADINDDTLCKEPILVARSADPLAAGFDFWEARL